jgi:hypothetical protein
MKLLAKLSVLAPIALLLITSPTVGYAWDNGGVATTIEAVTVMQDGTFYINAVEDICDSTVNKVAYVYNGTILNDGKVNQTLNGTNMLLSTALSAQASSKKVVLYADDSGTWWGCRLGAIKIMN